jgi:two-component system LytT family response regulator
MGVLTTMNSLRLLIVDDEPLIRRGIRKDLSGMRSVQVIGECDCVADAVAAIRSNPPDLVLLDVQLPDGTGFDVVRQVGPRHMPAVVFVTAHDKYAIQAFDVNAVDYLQKPFDECRLRASVERARERLARPSVLIRQLEGLIQAHESQWLERLVVRSGERFDFVQVDLIDWIESANNYTVLHCRSKDYVFGETLSALERRLDPARFCRVHRCHIVNVTRIVAATALVGGVYEFELRSGQRVRTGRQHSDSVRRLLKEGR